jgi:hypothetical protein
MFKIVHSLAGHKEHLNCVDPRMNGRDRQASFFEQSQETDASVTTGGLFKWKGF